MMKKRNYIFLLLCFLFLHHNLSSAQNKNIDSLLTLLPNATEDEQFTIYIELTYNLQRNNLKKANFYLSKAEKLINLNENNNQVFKYFAALAKNKLYGHEYENSIEIAHKALAIQKNAKDNDLINLYSTMGTCHYYQSEYEEAVNYHLKALKICDELNDDKNKANIHNNISVVYMGTNDWEKVEKYTLSALQLAEKYKNNYEGSRARGNMAILYAMQGKLDLSEEWFIKDLEFDKKLGDSMSISKNYNNLGKLYGMKQDFLKALIHYKKALNLAITIDDKASIALGYQNVAHAQRKLGKYNKAISNFKKGLEMTKTLDNRDKHRDGLLNISELYYEIGDFKQALEYYDQYHLLNDSIINTEHLSSISELEIKYETEKKEKDILALSAEKIKNKEAIENQQSRIKNLTTGLVSLAILGIAFFIIFKQNSSNKKQRELIAAITETQIEERKRIAQDLHDGVGGTLALAKNKLEVLLSSEKEKSKEVSEFMETLSDTANQIRQISHNMMPGELVKFGLVSAVKTTLDQIENQDLKTHLYTHNLDDRIDQTKEIHTFRIIQEIIQNVLKHANAKTLNVHLNRYPKILNLLVEDDGIGFAYNAATANGLGLKNIKSRVHYLNGKFHVDSASGKGTTFNIEIPL